MSTPDVSTTWQFERSAQVARNNQDRVFNQILKATVVSSPSERLRKLAEDDPSFVLVERLEHQSKNRFVILRQTAEFV
jgi:hypothetical protein